jgi:hypothetical protein
VCRQDQVGRPGYDQARALPLAKAMCGVAAAAAAAHYEFGVCMQHLCVCRSGEARFLTSVMRLRTNGCRKTLQLDRAHRLECQLLLNKSHLFLASSREGKGTKDAALHCPNASRDVPAIRHVIHFFCRTLHVAPKRAESQSPWPLPHHDRHLLAHAKQATAEFTHAVST